MPCPPVGGDIYHALEKLALYADFQYPQPGEQCRWMEARKEQLPEGNVAAVMAELREAVRRSKEARKAKQMALCYCEANNERMQYKTFREQGFMIGPGAVEAVHRNIVQQHLKLPEQKWFRQGAQQIVNLRACKKSNQCNTVVELIKIAA